MIWRWTRSAPCAGLQARRKRHPDQAARHTVSGATPLLESNETSVSAAASPMKLLPVIVSTLPGGDASAAVTALISGGCSGCDDDVRGSEPAGWIVNASMSWITTTETWSAVLGPVGGLKRGPQPVDLLRGQRLGRDPQVLDLLGQRAVWRSAAPRRWASRERSLRAI